MYQHCISICMFYREKLYHYFMRPARKFCMTMQGRHTTVPYTNTINLACEPETVSRNIEVKKRPSLQQRALWLNDSYSNYCEHRLYTALCYACTRSKFLKLARGCYTSLHTGKESTSLATLDTSTRPRSITSDGTDCCVSAYCTSDSQTAYSRRTVKRRFQLTNVMLYAL